MILEKVGNVILFGTSHVGKNLVPKIKKIIDLEKPDLVCLELDYKRLKSLLSKEKNNFSFFQARKIFGFFGALFLLIGNSVQNHFSRKLKTNAGIDMKTAYIYSREKNLKISLIDKSLESTIFSLSKLKLKDKLKIFLKIIKCSFRKEYKNFFKNMNFLNLRKENILKILNFFKKDFPKLNKILLENRNNFMVQKILNIKEENKKILVFAGAGHIYGMREILQKEMSGATIFNFSFILEEN